MAERVVDVLESVEVDDEQGAFGPAGDSKGIFEAFEDRGAIRQSGQRIVPGGPPQLRLGPGLFRQIGPEAAKADQLSRVGEDGPAGQCPEHIRIFGAPHRQIGERKGSGQVKAKGPLAADALAAFVAAVDRKVGQPSADDGSGFRGLAAEPRKISQAAIAADLPEPALAAVLEHLRESRAIP
jgi:hypothetical protein